MTFGGYVGDLLEACPRGRKPGPGAKRGSAWTRVCVGQGRGNTSGTFGSWTLNAGLQISLIKNSLLAGWLAGWLPGWLADWLAGWLAGGRGTDCRQPGEPGEAPSWSQYVKNNNKNHSLLP